MKAAQMGCTTRAMLKVLHAARFRAMRGILVLFPSRTDVLDYSRSRISPLIQDNPESVGQWVRDTDSMGLKQIWDCWVYFRGMQSTVGLRSIPVDLIVFEEMDLAPQTSIDKAMERMSHSEFREVLMLSNPTLPDYGIDKAFQETDQRHWLLKCLSCGHYSDLLETFPGCLVRD